MASTTDGSPCGKRRCRHRCRHTLTSDKGRGDGATDDARLTNTVPVTVVVTMGIVAPPMIHGCINRSRRCCAPLPLSPFPTGTDQPRGEHSVGLNGHGDGNGVCQRGTMAIVRKRTRVALEPPHQSPASRRDAPRLPAKTFRSARGTRCVHDPDPITLAHSSTICRLSSLTTDESHQLLSRSDRTGLR